DFAARVIQYEVEEDQNQSQVSLARDGVQCQARMRRRLTPPSYALGLASMNYNSTILALTHLSRHFKHTGTSVWPFETHSPCLDYQQVANHRSTSTCSVHVPSPVFRS
ncbi:hypothetical protein PISMIDRAFT_689201, partial [Pisolithus microcarpus 441]